MRSALATLPCVEQGTIKASRSTRTATFGINDQTNFNEDTLRTALGSRYASGMEILEIKPLPPTETNPPSAEATPPKP